MALLRRSKYVGLLVSALLWTATLSPVLAQALGAPRQGFLAANRNDLEATVIQTGGLLLDWSNNSFIAGTPGAITRYANFTAMFADLSGAITSSAKWVYNSNGVLTQFAANTPAQPCYSGGGALRGLCMEQRANNSLLWSEDFTQASWTKTGVAVTANNRTSPKATLTASTMTEDGSTGNHWLLQSKVKAASALTYTASCHVGAAAGNRSVVVYVDDGAGNGASAIFSANDLLNPPIPDGVGGTPFTSLTTWTDLAGTSGMVRVALTFTSNTATTVRYACGMADGTSISYAGDATSGLAVWGTELKQNSVGSVQSETAPSTYVPTTTVAVTRAQDLLTFAPPVGVAGLSEYSIVLNLRLARAANGLTNTFFSFANTAEDKRVVILQNSPAVSSSFPLQIVDAATTTITPAGPLNTYNQNFGIAARVKPTSYWIENTAQSIRTSTAVNYPTDPLVKIRLNSYTTGGTVTGNVGYTQIALMNAGLSNGTLQALLFPLPPFNPDQIIPPNYFTQAMINDIVPAGSKLFRSSPMPANDSVPASSFAFYPLTTTYSQSIAQANTSTAVLTEFAWLQWQNRCDLCRALATGTAAGTNLTLTGVTGFVGIGAVVAGTGSPTGTTIVSQSSGPPGGDGVYVTSVATTSTGAALTVGGPPNMKPNATAGTGFFNSSGVCVSPSFSNYARADAATYAQGLYASGYPAHAAGPCPAGQTWCGYLDPLDAQGIGANVVTYAAAVANPDFYFPTIRVVAGVAYATSIDWTIFPDGIIGAGASATYGVLCDCERADNNLASLTTEQMRQLALIHRNKGWKFAVITDGLVTAGVAGGYCGLGLVAPNCDTGPGGNLGTNVGNVDHFFYSNGQPAPRGFTFDSYMVYALNLFGPTVDKSKIIFQFNLGVWPGGTTTANATTAHDFVVANGFAGYTIAPIFAASGGDQCRYTNLKIELLLGLSTGTCPIIP